MADRLRSGRRLNVLGVGIDPVSLESAAEQIVSWASAREGNRYVCVTGMHGVMEAQDDAGFRAVLNGAELNVPDGMPLVFLGRLGGFGEITRVFGPDLMLEVWRKSESLGLKHFYYGGEEGVARRLADRMVAEHPGLPPAGVLSPPFRAIQADEADQFCAQINAAQPDIVWVGLGTPKQERWMVEVMSGLNARVLVGVGAAFDYNTGRLRRAPRWMQRAALEWFYRLLQEPRRLYRRYLLHGPRFVFRILGQIAGLRRYECEGSER